MLCLSITLSEETVRLFSVISLHYILFNKPARKKKNNVISTFQYDDQKSLGLQMQVEKRKPRKAFRLLTFTHKDEVLI
jgi:hypothetical protein